MKTPLFLLLGLTVVLMAAVSVTADELREVDVPVDDAVIAHDATDGERGVEEPLVTDENPEDSPLIIAPNPNAGAQEIMADITCNYEKSYSASVPILGSIAIITGFVLAVLVLKKQ